MLSLSFPKMGEGQLGVGERRAPGPLRSLALQLAFVTVSW